MRMDAIGPRGIVLERDGELKALRAAVDAAREGAGRLVVVEGPPGIGKTALLETAIGYAGAQDIEVLQARGEQLERDYAYGVIQQLLQPPLAALGPEQRRDVLSGAAGSALGVLTPTPGVAPGGDREALAAMHHGLYWLVAGLAERRALLLA